MNKSFSKHLIELRQDKGLTQEQLSKVLNYTQGNISGWENGTVEPKATAILSVATFFGVSADYLLGLEDDFGSRSVAPMGEAAEQSEKEKALLKAFKKLLPETQDFIVRTTQSLSETKDGKTVK